MTYTKPRNNSHKYPVKCLSLVEVKKRKTIISRITRQYNNVDLVWYMLNIKSLYYPHVQIITFIQYRYVICLQNICSFLNFFFKLPPQLLDIYGILVNLIFCNQAEHVVWGIKNLHYFRAYVVNSTIQLIWSNYELVVSTVINFRHIIRYNFMFDKTASFTTIQQY